MRLPRTLGTSAVGLTLAMGMLIMSPQARGQSFVELRQNMVQQQIVGRGVTEPGVLRAMEETPRHEFVPEPLRDQAYVDGPLAIGWGQTISQPYIVALMTALLELDSDAKVLEIGTGSGYQAAVLSRIVRDVYSIEIRTELAEVARKRLSALGYDNVHLRVGDGYQGWPEEAPFDGIIVTAAPERIPEPLLEQLKVGGKLVIPVGAYFQDLEVHTKTAHGMIQRKVIPVRFVPMIGEVEKKP